LLAVVPALGALNVSHQPDQSPKEQYTALAEDYQKLQIEFAKLYSAAKTDEERKEVLAKLPDADTFADKMLAIAEKHPKDAVALDALVWVLRYTGNGKQSERAFDLIARNYLEDPQIVKVLNARNAPGNEKLLQTVLEKNPDKAAQGLACFYLAQILKSQSQLAARQKKSEAAANLTKQVEAMFDRVVKDYGDISDPRDKKGKRLRDLVEPELFEMRHLVVGKVVPDIEAEDIDGKAFKLSDYRGKVVMLDFWGHW
jgi:hypothetical protein